MILTDLVWRMRTRHRLRKDHHPEAQVGAVRARDRWVPTQPEHRLWKDRHWWDGNEPSADG